jgi:HSP20 family protein
MFSLMPWWKERKGEMAPVPRGNTPFGLMRREFANLFDRFFGGLPVLPEPSWEMPTYLGLEIEEVGPETVVKAEMPGFEPAEIEVVLTGETLKIKAEHKAKGKEKEEVVERRLEREVTVPAGTVPEQVEARYHNGILEVHLPKPPEAVGRRIEVKT